MLAKDPVARLQIGQKIIERPFIERDLGQIAIATKLNIGRVTGRLALVAPIAESQIVFIFRKIGRSGLFGPLQIRVPCIIGGMLQQRCQPRPGFFVPDKG